MVPLIDAVLVLLAIFIVKAPLLTNAAKLDLPKATWHTPSPARYRARVPVFHPRYRQPERR
jgi:biopolymer transport protein ExbD